MMLGIRSRGGIGWRVLELATAHQLDANRILIGIIIEHHLALYVLNHYVLVLRIARSRTSCEDWRVRSWPPPATLTKLIDSVTSSLDNDCTEYHKTSRGRRSNAELSLYGTGLC